jgi:hypothetical protein
MKNFTFLSQMTDMIEAYLEITGQLSRKLFILLKGEYENEKSIKENVEGFVTKLFRVIFVRQYR